MNWRDFFAFVIGVFWGAVIWNQIWHQQKPTKQKQLQNEIEIEELETKLRELKKKNEKDAT